MLILVLFVLLSAVPLPLPSGAFVTGPFASAADAAAANTPLGMMAIAAQHATQRAHYTNAVAALKARRMAAFESERAALGEHPLRPYLDYAWMMQRLRTTSGIEAREFVDAHTGGPLGVRYLGHYLAAAGAAKRWGDFLDAAAKEPRSESLRCYYARAMRGRGRQAEAWELAERLWLSERSVHKTCDPLFKLWRAQGGITDELAWERARLVYAARQGSLLRYVASLGSPKIQDAMSGLRRTYRQPDQTLSVASRISQPYKADLLTLGLERLSRYSPGRALRDYQKLKSGLLSTEQEDRIERAIAYRALLDKEQSLQAWIDRQLAVIKDDKLTGMRLRWAIGESDWASIERVSHLLSEAGKGEANWRYWRGRALHELGRVDEALALHSDIARERGFYGFMSADRLQSPYRFEIAQLSLQATPEAIATLPEWARETIWRVRELKAVDEESLALAEWAHFLKRLDQDQKLAVASIARDENWHRMSIDATNASKTWDAVTLRFPLAYREVFENHATQQALPAAQLMAIARRESAFAPTARSPVGARGLMQLMPATGRAVAKSQGVSLNLRELYEVERNVDLGSTYYKQLLDRFGGNRAVALAAYNAGPNRVDNWVGKGMEVDAWIETIPYRETRDYVKAVLAYSVVFAHQMGESPALLTQAERHASY
ncbi:MAG: transglycosylase SLT domain-containing protein [Congregibacter sp.]